MTTLEKRSEERKICNIEAHYESPNLSLNVVIKNISGGGCFINTQYLDVVGTGGMLFIYLSEQKRSLTIPFRVVYTRDDNVANSGMGVRFLFNTSEDILGVKEILKKLD